MKVQPHHPLQEAIARMLFGIESVPPEAARRMVSQTALMAAEYVQAADSSRERMLEALKEAVAWIEDDRDRFDDEDDITEEWYHMARAALKEATND